MPNCYSISKFLAKFDMSQSQSNDSLQQTTHRQRSRHVTRQQLTQLAFRPPFLGLFTKIQTSIWSEFSGQKGMPCFASSLLDSNRRQRALQILNGPTGQEIKILVNCLLLVYGDVGGTANTYHIHHKRNWEDGEIQNPGDHLNEKVKNDVWKFLIWTFVFQDSTLIPKYINGQKVTCRLSMWCCTVGNYLSRD